MRPPICCICDKRMLESDEGGLIYFKKRPSDIEWEEKMKKMRAVGHPPYAEWFCNEHYEQAKKFSHLTIAECLKIIKK